MAAGIAPEPMMDRTSTTNDQGSNNNGVIRRAHVGTNSPPHRLSSSAQADDPVIAEQEEMRGFGLERTVTCYWMPAFAGMTAELRLSSSAQADDPVIAEQEEMRGFGLERTVTCYGMPACAGMTAELRLSSSAQADNPVIAKREEMRGSEFETYLHVLLDVRLRGHDSGECVA
jgi:hypothetical protein